MSTVWQSLSDVQADAVRATAAKHLRDPDELATELSYLFTRPLPEPVVPDPDPPVTVPTQEARTVTFTTSLSDPAWSLLGTTESGSTFLFPALALAHSAVNESLTLPTEQENTP